MKKWVAFVAAAACAAVVAGSATAAPYPTTGSNLLDAQTRAVELLGPKYLLVTGPRISHTTELRQLDVQTRMVEELGPKFLLPPTGGYY